MQSQISNEQGNNRRVNILTLNLKSIVYNLSLAKATKDAIYQE